MGVLVPSSLTITACAEAILLTGLPPIQICAESGTSGWLSTKVVNPLQNCAEQVDGRQRCSPSAVDMKSVASNTSTGFIFEVWIQVVVTVDRHIWLSEKEPRFLNENVRGKAVDTV